ncbi:MAG: hypothetical protein J6V31_02285, partial [Tidjanibacter sp.]|nr:hypothetical protein [Tidjanibacter sp.]
MSIWISREVQNLQTRRLYLFFVNLVRRFLDAGVLGAAKSSQTLFFIASIIPTIFYDYGGGFLGGGIWGAAKASQTLFFISSIIPTIFCDYGERIFRRSDLGIRAA